MMDSKDKLFEDLISTIVFHNSSRDGIKLLRRAYDFADKAHEGQKRASGDPFIIHPLAVSIILARINLDIDTIAAGILHDVVEDTGVTFQDIEEEFNHEIASLVRGVTKLNTLPFESSEQRHMENLRIMFLATIDDIRVILIKLADRLHNMRTLKYLDKERIKRIASDTLDIYAPLANRLGIGKIKNELEDLAFKHLEPEKFRELTKEIKEKRRNREGYIKEISDILTQKLGEVDITGRIEGRNKHIYSTYQKIKRKGVGLNQIYDLVGVRIIAESVKDCYSVLGIIHSLWKPIIEEFDDYIAMPRPNMYQSLHTTVFGPRGYPLEIQIRTDEMHRFAEYGVAAHWRYKEGMTEEAIEEKLPWIKQLMEWQQAQQEGELTKDPREFMESLKIDLFADRVFVFTPKGEVIDLPAGSTPIDFAYKIHTEVGNTCVGAKVNGKMVSLDYTLRNSDIVEIITSKSKRGPSRDWLFTVKTSRAKSKIRYWLRNREKELIIQQGREELEKEIRKSNLSISKMMKTEKLKEMAERLSFKSIEDLLASIGYGNTSPKTILNQFSPSELPEEEIEVNPSNPVVEQGLRIWGIDDVMVRFSKCCNPVPGDPIVGYITRGKGISIHRIDCPNIRHLLKEPGRKVEVSWDGNTPTTSQTVTIEIRALDRSDLLSDITKVTSTHKINISGVNLSITPSKVAIIRLSLDIFNLDQLQNVMKGIEAINSVTDVYRLNVRRSKGVSETHN